MGLLEEMGIVDNHPKFRGDEERHKVKIKCPDCEKIIQIHPSLSDHMRDVHGVAGYSPIKDNRISSKVWTLLKNDEKNPIYIEKVLW